VSGEVPETKNDVRGIFADASEIHERKGHGAEAYLNSGKNQKRSLGYVAEGPIIRVRSKGLVNRFFLPA
jgi:hypothetical protein